MSAKSGTASCFGPKAVKTATATAPSTSAKDDKQGNMAPRKASTRGSPQQTSRLYFWASLFAFLPIVYGLCSYLDSIKERFYILDPTELHVLTLEALSIHPESMENSTSLVISHIVKNLAEKHGTTRINTDESEWFFSNAGGAMGAMYVIHASVTEYLIIFGTPLGTEGHTGRHTADDYFHIIQGEQWAFSAGALDKEVYPVGSVHHLPRGTVKQYKMHEGCFALEYARGWIPLMMPFGLADIFTSTMDFPTLFDTLKITAREIIGNLLTGKI